MKPTLTGNAMWNRLKAALPSNSDVSHTTLEDWMLMSADNDGTVAFKHCDTRNYIFLKLDDTLVIPKTDKAFMRGVFSLD